jgi:hypothetical protein
MLDALIKDIQWKPENRVMVGGNFSAWYGGFQSYVIASEMRSEIWIPTSHSSRPGENQIPDVKILPRVSWFDWIRVLSTFKYAINLMPTAAAGTFSLNCAYFGIPCISNKNLDTQSICHPDLSIDVRDIDTARKLAHRLVNDEEFYRRCSETAKTNYDKVYASRSTFVENIRSSING